MFDNKQQPPDILETTLLRNGHIMLKGSVSMRMLCFVSFAPIKFVSLQVIHADDRGFATRYEACRLEEHAEFVTHDLVFGTQRGFWCVAKGQHHAPLCPTRYQVFGTIVEGAAAALKANRAIINGCSGPCRPPASLIFLQSALMSTARSDCYLRPLKVP